MNFLLILVLAGVVAFLWRRSDALQAQIAHLEHALDALRDHVARQLDRDRPVDDPAIAPPETVIGDVQPEGIKGVEITAIPASRRDDNPPTLSQPAAPLADPEDRLTAPRPEPDTAPSTAPDTAPKSAETVELPQTPRFQFDFEDFFGRLLPIWAGGIALAVAGFFLVRYSIEQGLLGPEVRTALGFLFGAGLLGAAEIAYRQEHRIADPRVRQALAGAGLATLYASFYMAGTLYGLIGSSIAFLGMAGVTGAAILLSFRFGLPSAILGLVGGFAAPMMVASDGANVPVLALYLALVTGGLTYAGNRQGRSWLALAALAGGFGWGVLMLISGVTGFTDVLAFGGYIVVLGAVLPAFMRTGDGGPIGNSVFVRVIAPGLAAVQMAAMVGQSGFTLLAWGLYGLLAASLAFFAWREPRLREASAFAAGLAIIMLGLWPTQEIIPFAIAGFALTVIFAGVPLANIWRGVHRRIDTLQVAGFTLGMIVVSNLQLWTKLGDGPLAGVTIALAVLPALAARRLWPDRDHAVAADGLVAVSIAAIGVVVGGLLVSPVWAAPLVFAAVALGIVALGWQRKDTGLTALAWAAAVLTVLALLPYSGFETELFHLGTAGPESYEWRGIIRWIAALLPFAALALRAPQNAMTYAAEAVASILLYGVIAQIAPSDMLPWIAAGLALLLAGADRERIAARLTFALIAFVWAALPLSVWLAGGASALAGIPMLLADAVTWRDIGLFVLPLLAAGASLITRPADATKRHLALVSVISGLIAIVAGHMIFKQLFALVNYDQFVAAGMAERTVWQALLLFVGAAVWKLAEGKDWTQNDWTQKDWTSPVAAAFAVGALGHFVYFTFILHNPLWSEQAVGALPVVNLLLPAYGLAIGSVLLLRELARPIVLLRPWIFDAAIMVLIGVLTLSELRHLFAGSVLTDDPVGQAEDLLRSVLGIILAIGFLLWGARAQSRSWRIGSLVLMLGAVLKVFLLDASGLDGLVRVASFVALGFSLIGIGWFYTRQLASAKTAAG